MATIPTWQLERESVRLVFAYGLKPGIDPKEFEQWLYKLHIPDLLANPYIKRLVLNRVIATPDGESQRYYRTAEQHFEDIEHYHLAQQWRQQHPVPYERSAAPRIEIDFRVICLGEEINCDASRSTAAQGRR